MAGKTEIPFVCFMNCRNSLKGCCYVQKVSAYVWDVELWISPWSSFIALTAIIQLM